MTEHEELLLLREQIKLKDEMLAEKDQLLQKKDIQIESLTQALLHARKKMFGASSEKSSGYEGQMSLFDDVEEL